jgi:hypothetical protein
LDTHPLRGAIFEGMVITELVKKRTNSGLPINLYYWRNKIGHEIDLLVDNGGELLPIEIKSGKTVRNEFFKNLDYWMKLSGANKAILFYAGAQIQNRSDGKEILPWRSILEKDF